jgi:hypothetical protein
MNLIDVTLDALKECKSEADKKSILKMAFDFVRINTKRECKCLDSSSR